MNAVKPGAAFAISLGAITLIGPLSIHLFLPAMPDVKAYFAVSDALVQLTFSVTLITMAVVTPAYGSISDRYGRRRVLLAGLSLFLAGSLVAAVAPTLAVLVFGRLVQAAGAGSGLTLTRAIARDAYGPAALVKAIAYLAMAYTLGPMVAPPLGGLLIDAFGWRTACFFALAAGLAIWAAAYFWVPETRPPSIGVPGQTGMLRHYGALMRDRRFLLFVLHSGCMSFMFFAVIVASPFLMKDVLGRTAAEYGLYFMCFPLGYCAGNWVSSRLSGRIAIENMVLCGALLCFAAVLVQAMLILQGHFSPATIFVPGSVFSVAQGLSLPNSQAGAIRVAPNLAGTAAGLSLFIQMMLSALATEFYGVLADGTPRPMIWLTTLGSFLAVVTAVALFIGPRGAAEPILMRTPQVEER
jgi:MFS transporter, DHA1 family, multidrug resistance protein